MEKKLIQDARNITYAVKEISDIDLTPRPYNRFEPDDTIWWLVPSTEWPAYKYGKLFFDSRSEKIPNYKDEIFFGFYIEKGLGQKVSKIYHQSLIMDDDWLWKEFIYSLLNNKISPILSRILFPKGELILAISINNIPPEKASLIESPESFLSQKERFEASYVLFKILGDQFKTQLFGKRINPVNQDIAKYTNGAIIKSTNLAEIASKLINFPNSEWMWIDFYLGATIQKNIDEKTAIKLWKEYLEHWKPWLR